MTRDTAARSALVYAALSAFVVLTAIVVRSVPAGPLANALALPLVAFVIGAGVIGLLLMRRGGISPVFFSQLEARRGFFVSGVGRVALCFLNRFHSLFPPGPTPLKPL